MQKRDGKAFNVQISDHLEKAIKKKTIRVIFYPFFYSDVFDLHWLIWMNADRKNSCLHYTSSDIRKPSYRRNILEKTYEGTAEMYWVLRNKCL
jgi:hypothetical protein